MQSGTIALVENLYIQDNGTVGGALIFPPVGSQSPPPEGFSVWSNYESTAIGFQSFNDVTASFYLGNLTDNREYEFPNESGTIALERDIEFTVINGIYTFYGDIEPSTRPDSSPLVNGDMFQETGVRTWHYKDGYWLSEPFFAAAGFSGTASSTFAISLVQAGLIYLRKLQIIPINAFNHVLPAYWSIGFSMWTTGTTIGNTEVSWSFNLNGSYDTPVTVDINTAGDHYGSSFTRGAKGGIKWLMTKVGSPSNAFVSFVLEYSIIRES
jgi:hypothetical protein